MDLKVQQYIKEAEDRGRHLEAGFRDLMARVYPRGVGEGQYQDLRKFFFAGGAFLFAKLLNQMDEDREPTPSDLALMARIQKEINEFTQELYHG